MTRASALLLCTSTLGCGGDAEPVSPDAAVDLTPVVATPGARCAPHERVGLVVIRAGDHRVFAHLVDRPDPQLGEPALSDSACDFHRYQPEQPCEPCDLGEVCGLDGACSPAPLRDTAGQVILRAGGAEQVFNAHPELGELSGEITLPPSALAVEVTAFGQTVTLAETELPAVIGGFSAQLVGSYDAPEGIEARWDPLPGDSQVFTHVPINHHAAAQTFTECAIAASSGSLSIGQQMLEPLAVSTGLEFQGFEHVRFAAAAAARGCIEIRIQARQTQGIE